jgi:hypothetical protein
MGFSVSPSDDGVGTKWPPSLIEIEKKRKSFHKTQPAPASMGGRCAGQPPPAKAGAGCVTSPCTRVSRREIPSLCAKKWPQNDRAGLVTPCVPTRHETSSPLPTVQLYKEGRPFCTDSFFSKNIFNKCTDNITIPVRQLFGARDVHAGCHDPELRASSRPQFWHLEPLKTHCSYPLSDRGGRGGVGGGGGFITTERGRLLSLERETLRHDANVCATFSPCSSASSSPPPPLLLLLLLLLSSVRVLSLARFRTPHAIFSPAYTLLRFQVFICTKYACNSLCVSFLLSSSAGGTVARRASSGVDSYAHTPICTARQSSAHRTAAAVART